MMIKDPYFEFEANGKPKTCSWESYARFLSALSHVNRKYSVVALLKLNIDCLHDRKLTPNQVIWTVVPEVNFTPEQIMDLKSILAMQILSLATELTENLAAVCYAYAEAVDHGHKYFPLLLRDFGLSERQWREKGYGRHNIGLEGATPRSFYKDVQRQARLKRYLGNPVLSEENLTEFSAKFTNLAAFRHRMDRWYNMYKHVHVTVPVHYNLTVNGLPATWHILHRVPDYLEVDHDTVEFRESDSLPLPKPHPIQEPIENASFLSPLELLPDAKQASDDVIEIWQYVRRIQHKHLFGEVLP